MSQIRTRKVKFIVNHQVVDNLPGTVSLQDLVKPLVNEIPSLREATKDLTVRSGQEKSNAISSSIAPDFNRILNNELNRVKNTVGNELKKLKQASVRALLKGTYRVDKTQKVQTKIQDILSASNRKEWEKAVNDTMNTIKGSQIKVLMKATSKVIEEAGSELGFSQIKMRKSDKNQITINAVDNEGRALLSEIRLNEKDEVEILTETIGMTDETCDIILNKFDRILEQKGIHIKPVHKEWTIRKRSKQRKNTSGNQTGKNKKPLRKHLKINRNNKLKH